MPKKSDRTLAKRMEQLKARGFDARGKTTTIAEIVDVIGDLTVAEFEQMLSNERFELRMADSAKIWEATQASREADRQRTLRRQAELRAQKEKRAEGGT
jgi:hypothetical protein